MGRRREKEGRRGNVPRRGKKKRQEGREREKKRYLDYLFHSLSLC